METKTTQENKKKVKSLNRTMQYGNYTIGEQEAVFEYSLNRTMQYGNNKKPINKTTMEKSLNRTMQYGNSQLKNISGGQDIV